MGKNFGEETPNPVIQSCNPTFAMQTSRKEL